MAFGEAPARERTEQPTPRRREEARRRGHVARSADLGPAALLLGALGALALWGPTWLEGLRTLLARGLEGSGGPPEADALPERLGRLLLEGARLTAPLVLGPVALSVAAQLVQSRFLLSWTALRPDWARVDPRRGLERWLSRRSAVELGKALARLLVLGALVTAAVRAAWPRLVDLGQAGPRQTLVQLAGLLLDLAGRAAAAWLALAALDYLYQWWEHERSLRMSREEVREELRHTEGEPRLRARLRALHRRVAARRLVAAVRQADVVVRNPEHVAVALAYRTPQMRAPRVVAKGAGALARRILDEARRHAVPVVEHPPLARLLYRLVDVGQEIPASLYRAVAEVLAYIYALRARSA
jgi:flagellar biosynthetic protein FlhB